MAGSERISLYCLCNLLQANKQPNKKLPFPLSGGILYFYLGASPAELLCREGSAVSHPHPAARRPCQLSHQTQPELSRKQLKTLDAGWRTARRNWCGRRDSVWFWPANTSSSSKRPESSFPEIPPELNYSTILWRAFLSSPSKGPAINLFVSCGGIKLGLCLLPLPVAIFKFFLHHIEVQGLQHFPGKSFFVFY